MSMDKPSKADGIYQPQEVNDPRVPRLPQQNFDGDEELRSVPSADCSNKSPFFSESNVVESRSLMNKEPRNDIGTNTPVDIYKDHAGSSHEYADRVNAGTNAMDGRSSNVPGHAFNGTHRTARQTAVLQQHIPLVKRRQWNDPPTPPLDTWLPEVLHEEAAAAFEHQHELEYMDVHEYPSVPEDGFYPNVDTQQEEGNPASKCLFLTTVQYASYRDVKFRDHDGYFTGRICIAGFQNRQIYVWNDERFMELSMEIFDKNDTGEIQYCNSGTIEFPHLIQRETLAVWYDPYQPFLCFRAMYS